MNISSIPNFRVNTISKQKNINKNILNNTNNKKFNELSYSSCVNQRNFLVGFNNINFKAKNIDEKYKPFKKDITQYILKNDNYETKEIEKIFKKYSPTTSFKDFSSLPNTTNAHEGTAGYTEQKISFAMGNDGKLELQKFPQVVYMMFPKGHSLNDKTILLDRILHESTHVFNADSKEGALHHQVIENYIKSSKNIQKTMNTLKITPQIFSTIDKKLLFLLARMKKMGSLPCPISENENIDKLFSRYLNVNSKTIIKSILMQILKNASNICDFDKDFVLDYIIAKADDEKEAYINALESNKNLLKINGKTDFDLRIELYDSLINSVKALK